MIKIFNLKIKNINIMSQTTNFSLELDRNTISSGDNFTLSVYVNNNPTVSTNTVFLRLNYSQNEISFINSDFTGTAYPNIVENKTNNGQIQFTSFSTNPVSQDHQLVGRFLFQALTDSPSQITLDPSSKIHAYDGKGTNVVNTTQLPLTLVVNNDDKGSTVLQQNGVPIPIAVDQTTSITANQTKDTQATNLINESTSPSSKAIIPDNKGGVTDYSTYSALPRQYPVGQNITKEFITTNYLYFIIISCLIIISIIIGYLIIRSRQNSNNNV
jgi:hypothetical protein